MVLCLAARRLFHSIIPMFFYTSSSEGVKHTESKYIYILQDLNPVKAPTDPVRLVCIARHTFCSCSF